MPSRLFFLILLLSLALAGCSVTDIKPVEKKKLPSLSEIQALGCSKLQQQNLLYKQERIPLIENALDLEFTDKNSCPFVINFTVTESVLKAMARDDAKMFIVGSRFVLDNDGIRFEKYPVSSNNDVTLSMVLYQNNELFGMLYASAKNKKAINVLALNINKKQHKAILALIKTIEARNYKQ